ncbi:hypothetical protein JCM1840_004730 [Sporobolomyces johnsonii]
MAQYPFPTPYTPQAHASQYQQRPMQAHPRPYTHQSSTCAQTPAVAAASTSTSLASDPRVLSASLPLVHSPTTSQDPLGTSQNPLIPKRRRRTTPAELAILEDEFRKNSRPDQGERGRIAQRLGMTGRAVQVWYQNRRQKEKKESSSNAGSSKASSVASGDLSSPKDVEGVSLSFSSSPLPSPALPLYSTGVPSHPCFDVATTIKGLPSSQELYAGTNGTLANKENNYAHFLSRPAPVSNPAAPASEQQLQQTPYLYSYPSAQASQCSARQQSSSSAQPSPAASIPSVYLHRPSNASIIAAKKHVRKRPLGSHAPLARTPSLPHTFDFPPSPPKPRKHRLGRSWTTAEPESSGKVTLAEVASRKPSLKRNVSTSSAVATGSSLFSEAGGDRARSWLDSLSRRRTAGEDDSTDLDAAGEDDPDVLAPASASTSTMCKHAEADDLLRHMQSDPPSASSPGPLTRKRVFAHNDASLSATLGAAEDESDEGEDGDGGVFKPASYAQRPAFQHSHSQPIRTLSSISTGPSSSTPSTGAAVPSKARAALLRTNSLGGASPLPLPTSFSASPFSASPFSATSASLSSRSLSRNAAFSPSLAQAAESSRAGTEEACAISALGRKRARILSEGLSLSLGSLPRGGGGKEKENLRERSTKTRRSSGLSSTASTTNQHDTTDSESLADLSFSSTSTASTVDSLATVESSSGTGYFALTAAAKQLDSTGQIGKVGGAGAKDEERECAELLLGLGGFF